MLLRSPLLVALVGCALGVVACGGGAQTAPIKAFGDSSAKAKPLPRNPDGSVNDGSRCDWKNHPDREASETAGVGFIQPNVRRVYQVVGTGDDRHKVLTCREVDTNFDGIKDDFRWYSDKGEPTKEEADANYDGKIDTWLTFLKGRLAEERIDHNGDGNPDEWKYYSSGQLTRAKRATKFDGKPDIWEIYRNGELERMGVDIDGDGHVDRWDHDNEMRRRFEEQERKKEESDQAAAAKKAADDKDAAEKANDAAGGGDSKTRASKKKPK